MKTDFTKVGKEHIPMSKTKEFLLMNFAIILVSVGVYFFKLPNNFAIGGVTGIAVVLSSFTSILSTSNIITILNIGLLIVGFIIIGKDFGFKTAYSSVLLSLLIEAFEFLIPLDGPLTNEPLLELIFAVLLPGIGAALLFNIKASSGGTDIIAMIFKKYSSLDIGKAIFVSDILITLSSFFVFDTLTTLLAILGLMIKSFLVDVTIENINKVKYFFIVTETPEPIIKFITINLHRGGTKYQGEGIFEHHKKTIITVVCNNYEAIRLRDYIYSTDPKSFITILNTSQIVGKGFRNTF